VREAERGFACHPEQHSPPHLLSLLLLSGKRVGGSLLFMESPPAASDSGGFFTLHRFCCTLLFLDGNSYKFFSLLEFYPLSNCEINYTYFTTHFRPGQNDIHKAALREIFLSLCSEQSFLSLYCSVLDTICFCLLLHREGLSKILETLQLICDDTTVPLYNANSRNVLYFK